MTKGLVTVESAKRKLLYLLLRLALHRCRCEYLSRLYKLQYRLDLWLLKWAYFPHIAVFHKCLSYQWSVVAWTVKIATTVYEREIGFDEWVASKSEVKQRLEC